MIYPVSGFIVIYSRSVLTLKLAEVMDLSTALFDIFMSKICEVIEYLKIPYGLRRAYVCGSLDSPVLELKLKLKLEGEVEGEAEGEVEVNGNKLDRIVGNL